jgi:hypothetical protein
MSEPIQTEAWVIQDQEFHQSYECNAPDVIFENFGDETVLLHLESGKYFSLNPSAMYFWELLCEGVAPREISTHVAARYNGSADSAALTRGFDALLVEMLSEKLLRPSPNRRALAAAETAPAKLPEVFQPPAISTYDDVAELLALDPVHDVGEEGWPHPAPPSPPQE